MNIPIFELERIQSIHENTVKYNLTESGFHPFTLNELLTESQREEVNNLVLGYGQTNGSIGLRTRISDLYDNAEINNVLVTNGSAEANFITCHTLLEQGDEVVMMIPNYMQIWGIAMEMGCKPCGFHLREENGWAPDLEELKSLVSDKTKMIAVCNPNNPTGYTLTNEEMDKIIAIARSCDAWIYSDEVYRGAELNGVEIPSFYGRYEKVIVNGGLSKAYALPGLRMGWLTGPEEIIYDSWPYHDYTSISSGLISQKVAEFVLEPELRQKILNRNRMMLSENLRTIRDWVASRGSMLSFVRPKAGGMAFIHYTLEVNSTKLSDRLREEKSVFILPGDCYGMDHYFRIGIGAEKNYLKRGLALADEVLSGISLH